LDVLPFFLLGGVIVFGVAVPVFLLFVEGMPQEAKDFVPPLGHLPTRSVVDRPQPGVHFFEGELVSEGRALGPHRANRHVVEFTDFTCRHCQDDSLRAAHAVLCAQEQHKYWELRELLFQVDLSAAEESETVFTAKLLKRLANLAGLNLRAFAECFHSQRHTDEVRVLSKLARRMGVEATPTFIINGAVYEGALSREQLIRALHLQNFVG